MNTTFGEVIGGILVLILIGLIALMLIKIGRDSVSVSKKDWTQAEELCKANEGIKKVYSTRLVCNNDARFSGYNYKEAGK